MWRWDGAGIWRWWIRKGVLRKGTPFIRHIPENLHGPLCLSALTMDRKAFIRFLRRCGSFDYNLDDGFLLLSPVFLAVFFTSGALRHDRGALYL